jgi:hypothetical protein
LGGITDPGECWITYNTGLEDERAMAGTGYFGHLMIAIGDVRGLYSADASLQVELKITADGFAPGVAAMILLECHVSGKAGSVVLGQGQAIILQLGFTAREGGDKPYTTREQARWNLSQTAVQRLENARDGNDLTLHVTPEVVLLNHGEPLQDVRQPPPGAARPNVYPHCPIWHAPQEQLTISAEAWARQVLTPWQVAAAVTLIIKLPESAATDDHRTVIRALTDAQRHLTSGNYKECIRASREATEVLRGMHATQISSKRQLRTLDEREAAILDADLKLIQALYDYDSATHPDPGLRDIAWNRQHALLALATAAAVAQRLFSAA